MNPFLTCFIAIVAVIILVFVADKYNRYIDSGNENDDDLDLFH